MKLTNKYLKKKVSQQNFFLFLMLLLKKVLFNTPQIKCIKIKSKLYPIQVVIFYEPKVHIESLDFSFVLRIMCKQPWGKWHNDLLLCIHGVYIVAKKELNS